MKIALISSHGGHLSQILQLLEAFNGHDLFFVTYSSARDREIASIAPAYFLGNIGNHPHLFFWAFIRAFRILLHEHPQVVFSTGAEIALPFIFWAKIFRIKTFFLESWSSVDQLSETGRLVYRFVDEFWVQWPELAAACGPKARFFGAVI